MRKCVFTIVLAALLSVAPAAAFAEMDAGATVSDAAGAVVAPEAPTTAPDAVKPGEAKPELPVVTGETTTVEVSVEDNPVGFVVEFVNYLRSGQWLIGALMFLMLLTFALRKLSGVWDKLAFIKTRAGGYILLFVNTTIVAILVPLKEGVDFDFQLVSVAVVLAFGASGGWQAVKDLFGKAE